MWHPTASIADKAKTAVSLGPIV